MTRIPAVKPDDASPEIRQAYDWMTHQYGVVSEPMAVLANHPQLFDTVLEHEGLAGKACTALPVNIRDIAQYRAAWTIGCSYCVDFGAMIATLHGLRMDQLREIEDYETSAAYSDDERAAIAFAAAMTSTPPETTDEQVADLERRFGRAGVVELSYVIALENLRSRMNSALGAAAQGFSSGGACRVPWATESAAAETEVNGAAAGSE